MERNGKPCQKKRIISQLTPDSENSLNVSTDFVINMAEGSDLDLLSDNIKTKAMLREVLQEMGLDTIQSQLVDIQKGISYAQNIGEQALKLAQKNKAEIDTLKQECLDLRQQVSAEHEARLKLETHSRRSNLKFYGINEREKETDEQCEWALRDMVNTHLGIDDFSIERCHRLGPRQKQSSSGNKGRPIIVKFSFFKERENVWEKKTSLQGKRFMIREDFPPEIEQRVNQMMPIFLAAKKMPEYKQRKPKLVIDKLYLHGQMYTVETIHRLPPHLLPENIATKTTGNITLFWRKESFMSNFHPSPFTVDGTSYVCNEQYFQAQKATLFKDKNAYKKIMEATNPAAMKAVHIDNVDLTIWKRNNIEIMKTGLFHKFDQNPTLRKKLQETAPNILAEASPSDRYWGIGMSMRHPNASDTSKWGENNLGKLLVELRQSLA